MKKTLVFSLFLMVSAVGYAQEKSKPTAPPVPTDSQKLKYFKALSEYQSAAAQAEAANKKAQDKQAKVQDAAKILAGACGADFSPNLDNNGDLVCVANPVPPKK